MSNLARAGGNAHVAAERHVHSRADCCAVHSGDRRERAAGDAEESLVDVAQRRSIRFGQVSELGAGAERRRCAGDDDGADSFVGLELVHRVDDCGDHVGGEHVAPVGIVQRQGGHTIGDRGFDEAHLSSLPSSMPGLASDTRQ